MPAITYPNQRMVKIPREPAKSDFLGIKNENWQAAARDLGAHGLRLYLYLASNANNYTLALSPAAARAAVGIPRSTYFDYFQIMVNKGYLVPGKGNTFDFYEVPQSAGQSVPEDGLNFSECPRHGKGGISDGQPISPENIEINNIENSPNNGGINNGNKLTVDGNICAFYDGEKCKPGTAQTGKRCPLRGRLACGEHCAMFNNGFCTLFAAERN